MKAVVLLSGGIDSSTTLYLACKEGYTCYALIIDYGQRHRKEIEFASKIAQEARCQEIKKIKIDLPWRGSALLDEKMSIPRGRDLKQMAENIPVTYVPGRNMIFLSLAVSWAEVLEAEAVFIGANALDYSGYPDCRPFFFEAFRQTICKGTRTGVEGREIKIKTPLIDWTKAKIIEEGMKLGVPYEYTWSCYQGEDQPCGECDSCRLRAKGFEEAGFTDPLLKKS